MLSLKALSSAQKIKNHRHQSPLLSAPRSFAPLTTTTYDNRSSSSSGGVMLGAGGAAAVSASRGGLLMAGGPSETKRSHRDAIDSAMTALESLVHKMGEQDYARLVELASQVQSELKAMLKVEIRKAGNFNSRSFSTVFISGPNFYFT